MSPLVRVKSLDEIEIGKHGLYLKKSRRSGLLLPQVPVEWKWSLVEFLHHLCMKAGLPPNSHLDPAAELYRFEAEVFGEADNPTFMM
jgi:uncharacterized protein (TIGR00296 family)